MAIYEVIHGGTVYGQEFLNRWHYASTSTGHTGFNAEDVFDAFLTAVDPLVRALLSSDGNVVVKKLVVTNMYDDTDFFEDQSMNAPGTGSGTPSLPSFVASSFRTTRLRVGWRRGYKRFPGIAEGEITGNLPVAGWLTKGIALANIMESDLGIPVASPVDSIHLAVLRFQKVTDPETGAVSYQKQANESAQRTNMVLPDVWNFYRMTTQRSRISGQGN